VEHLAVTMATSLETIPTLQCSIFKEISQILKTLRYFCTYNTIQLNILDIAAKNCSLSHISFQIP
jgi:hypothetical protein